MRRDTHERAGGSGKRRERAEALQGAAEASGKYCMSELSESGIQAPRGQFGIGEVLAQLRPEFPDISGSKIRFLEAEGLIEPERTRSGYRKFGAADIQRLRQILTLQRDAYLPLRVIRERLADGGEAASGESDLISWLATATTCGVDR